MERNSYAVLWQDTLLAESDHSELSKRGPNDVCSVLRVVRSDGMEALGNVYGP